MILFSLSTHSSLADKLAAKLKVERGNTEIRNFPDGESYIRIDTSVANKVVILVADLDQPNPKALPLLFLAQSLKCQGAKKIYLIAPYLPYMRQDEQFKTGEAVSAILFAKFISSFCDGLITVAPHLHRIPNLSEIYPIPALNLHATQAIAQWIQQNIKSPLLIGPDEESAQWVAEVAKEIQAPYAIIHKIRHGDRKVSIQVPDLADTTSTPIIIDDIISTGTTMLAVIEALAAKNLPPPTCICVHALFNREIFGNLLHAGAQQVLSCNTIENFSNGIDLTEAITEGIYIILRNM